MGRPIKKLYIGDTAGSGQQLVINAWLPGDTQARNGFITEQTGTGRYTAQTTDGSNVFVNTVTLQNATATAAGQGAMVVTPYGAIGSGARANAVVSAQTVAVAAGGHGYTVGDTLTFSTGWGTNAVLTVATTTGNGAVATTTITNAGARTLTLPSNPVTPDSATTHNVSAASSTINFNKWYVSAVTVGVAGSGYDAPPNVNFTTAGSTIPAVAAATLSSGGVGSITVSNNGGTGYTSIPVISFTNFSSTQYVRKINNDTVISWTGNVYTWYPAGTTLTTVNSATLPSS